MDNVRKFVRMALRHGMVLVPRKPTPAMLYAGEGITDFILPDIVGTDDKETRMKELEGAWEQMIKQWEFEVAMMTRDEMTNDQD